MTSFTATVVSASQPAGDDESDFSELRDEQVLFDGLSPAGRHAVSHLTVSTTMKRGQLLVDPERSPRSVLLIRSGFVREYVVLPDGRQLTTRIVGAGGIVGEQAAVERPGTGIGVIALDPIECVAIPGMALRTLSRQIPELAVGLGEIMRRRLVHMHDLAGRLAYWPGDRRLADMLLRLDSLHGHPTMSGHRIISRAYTQADMARMVGTTRASVVRTLSVWRAAGMIEFRNRCVVILDRDALSQVAGHHEPASESALPDLTE